MYDPDQDNYNDQGDDNEDDDHVDDYNRVHMMCIEISEISSRMIMNMIKVTIL